MNETVETISLWRLSLAFVPVLVVVAVLYRWSVSGSTALYAVLRMLIQLMLVGYVLTFIFKADRFLIVVGALAVMLVVASWISLRPVRQAREAVYWKALASIGMGGVLTLLVVTQGVLDLEVWYEPSVVIPLAGMIFASSMNSVSLAAERFEAETGKGVSYARARQVALNTALIPLVNSLLVVGVVSFPGMMTGQILAGVEPLVAARYQVMVMCMIFGSCGLAAATYLAMIGPGAGDSRQEAVDSRQE